METNRGNRISAAGCGFAATYLVIVILVYGATAQPTKVGQDWYPVFMLAMPWYALDSRLLLYGFVANTALLYLTGAVLQRTSRTVGEWETELRDQVSTWGCCFAAPYLFILAVVFAVTAFAIKPGGTGMEWIPLATIAAPWFGLDARPLLPGVVTNTALLYLLGAMLQKLSRIVGEWG